tara:strand:+ start:274 stop:801 length:528 start_codon:yes stop_codon:yes gene_type:complete
MKKIYIVIFLVLIIPVLVSTVNAQILQVDVDLDELKDIEESKYKASGITTIRNIEGELISVVRVDASKYLDDPIIDQYLVTENPSVSLVKRGMLGADTISHYRVVVDYMNPVCSEGLFENPGFNDECDWYQAVFSTLFMIEHEGMEYQMFRGLNHNFIVKSGYDLTTYWDIFSRD